MAAEILQIEDILGKTIDNIYRVGLEVEGGWYKARPKGQIVHDGSVHVPNPHKGVAGEAKVNYLWNVGEVASPPLERSAAFVWLTSNYPTHVNASCGFHIHMSFKDALHYQHLMVESYQETMLDSLEKWAKHQGFAAAHPIWGRISGKNQFCKKEFFPDKQVQAKNKIFQHNGEGNRYTVINFCFGLHSTVECRVLPMFDTVREAHAAMNHVLDVTNACLEILGKREDPSTAAEVAVNPNDDPIVRERRRVRI